MEGDLFAANLPPPLRGPRPRVPLEPSSLCTGDVFVLVLPERKKMFTWYGNHCTPAQENSAETLREDMFRDYDHDEVSEEEESEEFLHYLGVDNDDGGLKPDMYAYMPEEDPGKVFYEDPPRFFITRCNQLTKFDVEPRSNVSRRELTSDVIAIVDGISRQFLWVGADSTERHRRLADALLDRFKGLIEDRTSEFKQQTELSGDESPLFKSLFIDWDISTTQKTWMNKIDDHLSLGRIMTDKESRTYNRMKRKFDRDQQTTITELRDGKSKSKKSLLPRRPKRKGSTSRR